LYPEWTAIDSASEVDCFATVRLESCLPQTYPKATS
jgi:hypothetical protein